MAKRRIDTRTSTRTPNLRFGTHQAPEHDLPRFCDGDIYGFAVITNDNPDDIDDIMPKYPYVDDDLNEVYVDEGTAGCIVAEGAIGMGPNQPGNVDPPNWLLWPAEAADVQPGLPDDRSRRPTIYKYQWYDTEAGEVKNSNRITMSANFHEVMFIKNSGKLRSFGTAYATKPAIFRMFQENNGGPNKDNGCDHRIRELWAEVGQDGYNEDINLVHVCCAADETIVTLDDNGTIRIVQSADSEALLSNMGETDEHMVVYYDKEDIANYFWVDENGNNVLMDNEDFVDVWCSGGGTSAQGTCVWGLHKNGTLYGQHMHSMYWHNKDAVLFDSDDEVLEHRGRWEATPYYIRENTEEGPMGDELVNLYHGAYLGGPNSVASEDTSSLDRYGYNSERQTSSVGVHYKGVSAYLNISLTMDPSSRRYVADPKYPTGLYPKWSNEAVKRALNQIPKNENGNRYKVISLFDGYGHGGGCVCVDPDVPSLRTGNINQQIEPVLLTSWAGGLHKHMYEQIHTIKKWRAVGPNKIGQYKYELNDKDIRKDDIYSFKPELYDLLFKSETGTYEPPIKFSGTRRTFNVLTNNGMAACFQGAGVNDVDAGGVGGAPLINYEIDETGRGLEPTGDFKLILDKNGASEDPVQGNWFFNYDDHDPEADPPIAGGMVLQWYSNPSFWISQWGDFLGDSDAGDENHGPHCIVTSAWDPQIGGRFGFGFMPPLEDDSWCEECGFDLCRDTIYPGINPCPWTDTFALDGLYGKSFHYFSYIDYLGYDFEQYYWNMESLVYFNSLEDDQGKTLKDDGDNFNKATSAIYVFHVGEGSPYSPFDVNPIIWWSGQGDNINVVFKNGVIDSCTYFASQMSSFVWPPIALPLRKL